MEGSLKDILVLFMLIIVYFLPYFLIFKLIKLSAGALGKIQGALDGASKWGRERGPIKSFKENAQKSAQTNRKNRNLETIGNQTSTINSDANKVRKGYARLRRGVARSAIGTFGATGAYGTDLASQERESGIKIAKSKITEDMRSAGITYYDDQLDYQVALAKGLDSFDVYSRDFNGNLLNESGAIVTDKSLAKKRTVDIKGASTFEKQIATESVMSQGKADRIRDIRTALASQGVTGDRIWADAMESQGSTVVKVAADVAGKPTDTLKASELATQDAGTLRNIANEYQQLRATGRTNEADRIMAIANDLASDLTLYTQVNQEGKQYIEYIRGTGGAPPKMSLKGYKGKDNPSSSKTMADALEAVKRKDTSKF